MLGIKENVVDIPYDIITSVKLEKGLISSTIRFKAPGLMLCRILSIYGSTRLKVVRHLKNMERREIQNLKER
jgi:hypothetical protein